MYECYVQEKGGRYIALSVYAIVLGWQHDVERCELHLSSLFSVFFQVPRSGTGPGTQADRKTEKQKKKKKKKKKKSKKKCANVFIDSFCCSINI